MKEKEIGRLLYKNLGEKSIKELIELAQEFELNESDLFDDYFKRELIQKILKNTHQTRPYLKDIVISRYGKS